ncbi:LPO_1073/Vpar_1526 family protein [Nocardioides gilvus]|uniref:LPO_1073/Vpar_1526 family protein n=1 Tax=Nocardioides gilvus TaxID=1735589 RepID=UPI000D7509B8|nr:LPO_1073/Vpar_1526 family protein [Nocardioides gilvus]
MSGQTQRAGDNAKQIMVAGDFNENITLDQAMEVAELVARRVVSEHFEKADALGVVRIEKLNERVLNRLNALDKLSAFADPAFQVLLRKAHIGAASTERDGDYDMLSELLTQRVERGDDRPIRAGIDRAVQVVDLLDSQALNGLTVLQAASQFSPASGQVEFGLATMDRLFGQFEMEDLPEGFDWLDHLDLLDAVRASRSGTLRRFADYYGESKTPGYLASGISSELVDGVLDNQGGNILRKAVIDHELKPGFSRVGHPSLGSLEKALEAFRDEAEVAEAITLAKGTFGLGSVDPDLKEQFASALDAKPNLAILRAWWDAIPGSVHVTPVGRVLAVANAKRCDEVGLLPPLD